MISMDPVFLSFSKELQKLAVKHPPGDYCICPSVRNTTCPIHGDEARERRAKEKRAAKITPSMFKAEAFHQDESKDWARFEKDLKSKPFQKAMVGHELTDAKLKKYVKNFGGSLVSKSTIAVAPSRTTKGKEYKVKVLPTGRLTCGCKDWQYYHSVRNSDCDHIKAVRAMYQTGLIKKGSVMGGIYQGMKVQRRLDIAKKAKKKGEEAQLGFRPHM